MLLATRRVIWIAGLCATGAATAQQPAPVASAASAASAQETVQPKISPLLMVVLGRIAAETGKKVGAEIAKETIDKNPGLFSNLMERLGWGGKASASTADERGLATAVGYTIQQLDPRSFDVIRALEVGDAPTVLKTGDVFAIHYSTNLPGQIRLENLDPAGRTSDLGTYTVQVDQLNRLPRDLGIRLQGEPGIELLKLYFYPCLPPEAADKSWNAQFKGRLPSCGRTPNTLVANAALGTIQPRTLVNLSQPDATIAFAGAADYRMNEVTLTVVRIKHERPGRGQ